MAAAEVLDVKQCAELLGFSEEHIRVMAREQKIPAAKIGGRWRFVRRQLVEWLEDLAIPEHLVEEQLLYEARQRLARNEPTRPLADVKADLGL